VLLAKELEGKTIPEAAAIEGIRLASSKGLASLIEESLRKAGNIRQMDKPLTPEEMTAMVAKVAKLGDPVRGERVYRRQQLLCITCHAIGAVGGVIGPDMVSLGASAQIDYIIESLLNPTAKIKEGYHMTMVTTKDGQVVAGGVAQDGPEELVIRDAGNNLHKIAKSKIAKKDISPVSLMPPGLTASLREDEFLDLVRFLSELGREGQFKTQPNKYIRVWRTMGTMEQVDIDHVRHIGLFALSERDYKYPWEMKFSLVNGDIPLDELAVPVKMYPWFPRIAQCDLEMPAAGKVKLKLSAAKGVHVAVNDAVVPEVTEELTLDLPAGKSVVSFVISRDAGQLQGFRVEILDGAAKVVTGG
jgi:putative heme-binding domain-containing protein